MNNKVSLSASSGKLALFLVIWGSSISLSAAQFDGIRLAYGQSFTNDVTMGDVRLAARWELMELKSDPARSWKTSVMLDAVVTHWFNRISGASFKSEDGADNITGVFITPILRMQDHTSGGVNPYLEAGIGVGGISDDRIRRGDRLTPLNKSSKFQFEVLVGGGFQFGQNGQYELGVQWVHYSNGNTASPNYSFDAIQGNFAYRF